MQYQNEQSPLIVGNGDDTMTPTSSHKNLAREAGSDSSNIDSSNVHKNMFLLLLSVSMLFAYLSGHSFTKVQFQRQTIIESDDENYLHTTVDFVRTGTAKQVDLATKHLKQSKHKAKPQEVAKEAFQSNLYQPSIEAEIFYHSTKLERKHLITGASIVDRFGERVKPKDPPRVGCQATVILLRHCEKGSIREHCNTIGFERAKYIANQFGNEAEAKWPAPSFLFAHAPGDRNNDLVQNFREIETIQPLSDKIGVPINTQYGTGSRKAFAKDIFRMLRSGTMCGKVALVSWKHEDIPHLARSLGCGPEDGCPLEWANDEDFDSTWQISYSYHKQLYPSFVVQEKKNKHKVWGKHPEWWISGHVEMEGFDPLQFSKENGVYSP